jgi:hypothetical protein
MLTQTRPPTPGNDTRLQVLLSCWQGGAIACKSKLQEVIALLPTEAEFVAACNAATMILFFRSNLEDLGIPQNHATVLF